MVLIGGSETLGDQDLIPAPMKPVHVGNVDQVKPFEMGDINPSAYREEELLKQDGVRVTGIDDRFQSTQSKAATATEAAILKESTMKRLRTKIWLNARTLLVQQLRLRTSNILQYYKYPKIREIMGQTALEKATKIRELAQEERLYKQKDKLYELEYRTIVTKNKALQKNKKTGTIDVVDSKGDNFFMVTPDLLPPSADVFHYKMSAEPTFPLSKPLMQQRMSELFNHPVIQMNFQTGVYSYQKAGDKMLELNDLDPDDLKPLQQENAASQFIIDPMRMIGMAGRENQEMMKGETLIGTPYATPEHTRIHLEFMKSDAFKSQANVEIIQNFTRHVLEEFTAQGIRAKNGGGPVAQAPGGGQPLEDGVRNQEQAGIMGSEAKAAMPGRMIGSEQVPDVVGLSR
jgi:hypothetical protein